MFEHTSLKEYQLVARGSELLGFPDICFFYGPLQFSIYDLAEHQWTLKVTQKRPLAFNLTRPKIRMYPRDSQQEGISIKVHSRPLYKNRGEVLEDLITFSSKMTVNFVTYANERVSKPETKTDVFTSLKEWNDEKAASVTTKQPTPKEIPDNVIDFIEHLKYKSTEDDSVLQERITRLLAS